MAKTKYRRLIDANKLKNQINASCQKNGSNYALNLGLVLGKIIDKQPTQYDEERAIKKKIKSLKKRIYIADKERLSGTISEEKYQKTLAKIEDEIEKIEIVLDVYPRLEGIVEGA